MYKSGTHHTPKLNFARLEQEVGKTNECQNYTAYVGVHALGTTSILTRGRA